jgi:hypothetical protein
LESGILGLSGIDSELFPPVYIITAFISESIPDPSAKLPGASGMDPERL